MEKGFWKKLTYESNFSRRFACWANNHGGWKKYKKANRKEMRRKLKEQLSNEIKESENE